MVEEVKSKDDSGTRRRTDDPRGGAGAHGPNGPRERSPRISNGVDFTTSTKGVSAAS